MKNIFAVSIFLLVSFILFIPTITKSSGEELNKKVIKVPYSSLSSHAKEQVECLTENIYFEASQESLEGQLAVAIVTMRRVEAPQYPSNVCGVVRQKISSTCQFSWWCESKLQHKAVHNKFTELELRKLQEIRKVAMLVFLNYGDLEDPTKGAMFYHANYVNPRWKLEKTATIGNHIFYKQRS